MPRMKCLSVSDSESALEAARGRRVYDDRDRIVEYLKKTKGEVSVSRLAKDLGMRHNRPSFVANHFPLTLVTWDTHHYNKRIYYIDLHHHLRRYHR